MPFNKNIAVLLVGLFLVMVGFGITLPVLPFYIQKLSLAEGISQQKLWLHVGLITGSYPLMQFLFAPYLGSLSDGNSFSVSCIIDYKRYRKKLWYNIRRF